MRQFKKIFKRIGAVVLSVGMVASMALTASADETSVKTGTFRFGAHDNNNDLEDNYVWSDDYFSTSADETNHHLAIMSMIAASASISSKDAADYGEKSQNIQNLLKDIGFQDVDVNQYYTEKMTQNSMGACVGYKTLSDGSVLLAVVPRSAGYESEWGGNFNVGADGLHDGFETGRNIVLGFAKDYVNSHADAFEGKTVKVWTMGYSRGAAVANLIGAALVDDSENYLGLSVDRTNVYAYTFGTPNTAPESSEPRNEKYNNIHNYYADYDPVAMLPLEQWSFDRYGQDVLLDVHDENTKARMLSILQSTNGAVYNTYTASEDPDYFSAKKIGFTAGEDGSVSFSIVADDSKTVTQESFLKERFDYLARYMSETGETSRSDYMKYQTAVVELVTLWVGGADETVAAFNAGVKGCSDAKKLAIALFLYDWVDKYIENKEQQVVESEWKKAEWLKAIEPGTVVEGDETATEIFKSEEYAAIYNEILQQVQDEIGDEITAGTAKYEDLLLVYQSIAGTYMKNALKAGLDNVGTERGYSDLGKNPNGEDYTAVNLETTHPLLQGDVPSQLAELIAEVLLGTDDELPTDFSSAISSAVNKVKTACTFIGNSSYMRVHNNEVILSWLRAMDDHTLTGDESWTQGSENGLTLNLDSEGEVSHIADVLIDGVSTDQYELGENGTILLKTDLLSTLSVGSHTVKVMIDTCEASHDFEVLSAAAPVTPETPETPGEVTPVNVTPTETSAQAVQSVKTGDESQAMLWLVIGLAAVALAGVALTKRSGNK